MGDYVFDQYRKRLEQELEKLNILVQKVDELKSSIEEMRKEIEFTLSEKKEEEIEAEFNPIKEEAESLSMDEVVEETPAEPVVNSQPKPTIDPNLANPAALDLGIETPVEKPVQETPKTGLTNLKESLESYPETIDIVNPATPAEVKVEEKPKKTMFKTPEFKGYDDISIDIVNPNATPAQPVAAQPAAPQPVAPEQAAQFGQAPQVNAVPGITPGQSFTDGVNNNPTIS